MSKKAEHSGKHDIPTITHYNKLQQSQIISKQTGRARTNLVSLLHQNLRSIGNSADQLEMLLSIHSDCHFLCVTEHWKSIDQLKEHNLRGYYLVNSYCRQEGQHGGSAVYARHNLHGLPRDDLSSLSVCNVIECAASEFRVPGAIILVMSVYRPDTDIDAFFVKMEEILNKVDHEDYIILISGDFNIDIRKNTRHSAYLLSLLSSYGLFPSTREYTRITDQTKSCIDNIYTNIKDFTCQVLHTHISDHTAQKITFGIDVNPGVEYCTVRNFSDENVVQFKNMLSQHNWNNLYLCNELSVTEQYQEFMNTFIPIFNACFPKKKGKKM